MKVKVIYGKINLVIKMEFLQLKYFCDAAVSENFSHTAKKYGLPTSAISQTIKRLEKELGVSLFDRNSNKIHLNEQGRTFYRRICQALSDIEDAQLQLCKSAEEIGGSITLLIRTNRRVVTKAIEKFKSQYPKVCFIIKHTADIERDDFDICIDDGFLSSKVYDKELLLEENITLAINRGHKLEKEKHISPSLLCDEGFITMPNSSSLFRLTKKICQDLGFEPNIIIQCDDPFYLRRYVELGLGVAFVPMRSWQGLFPENVIFKNIDKITRQTFVYVNKRKRSNKTISAFVQLLKSTVNDDN